MPPLLFALALLLAASFSAVETATAATTPDTTTSRRAPKLSDLFGDEVVARGRGVEVKRSLLELAFTAEKAKLAAGGQNIPEDRRAALETQLLQRLLLTQILTNRATAADWKQASELVEARLQESIQRALSQESFYRQLKAAGISPEQYVRTLTDEASAQAVIQRELASTIQVSDAQVHDLYETGTDLLVQLMQADLEKLAKESAAKPEQLAQMKERIEHVRKSNLARLVEPERVRIGHIFFTTRDRKTEQLIPEEEAKAKRRQLEKLRQRAVDGDDFAKLIQDFSEDRSLKENKGEYTFNRESSFPEELKAAAFSLAPGKISDVVVSGQGLHVIKLLERLPAKKVAYEKIAPNLKEFLLQQGTQRAMPGYFSRLSKEASIEILDAKYQFEYPPDLQSAQSGNSGKSR